MEAFQKKVLLLGIVIIGIFSSLETEGTSFGSSIENTNGATYIFSQGAPIVPCFYRGAYPLNFIKKTGFSTYIGWWVIETYHPNSFEQWFENNVITPGFSNVIIMLRFSVAPNFAKEYPSEVVCFEDGEKAEYFNDKDKKLYGYGSPRYSLASKIWSKESCDKISVLIDAIEKSKYANRVLGFMLTAGSSGEWGWWCDFSRPKHMLDFSPAMLDAFKEHVQKKYDADVLKLRLAWNDNDITFSSISLPDIKQRKKFSFGDFYHPVIDRKVLDYWECHSMVVSQRILELADCLKNKTQNKVLVGCFFACRDGWDYHSETLYHESGHNSYRLLLDSPSIDFIATPPSYESRSIGDAPSMRSLEGSLKLRNKLFFSELDIRTHLVPPAQRKFGAPADIPQSLALLWRNFSQILCNNTYGYWCAFEKEWYDHPDIIKSFRNMQDISCLALNFDRSSNSEIAVIISEESISYCKNNLINWSIHREELQELGYIGHMVDFYDINDIPRPELQRYKLYIFLNAYSLNNDQRRSIENNLKRNGKVLLWLYASGLINPDKKEPISSSYMKELTGIDIKYEIPTNETIPLEPDIIVGKNSLSLPENYTFGQFIRPLIKSAWDTPKKAPRIKLNPRFFVQDDNVTNLGIFKDSSQQIGFAMKKQNDYTSFYIGTPAVSANIIRAIAKYAGVHCYIETDGIVYHNSSFFAIHSGNNNPTSLKIYFPEKMDIYALQERTLIAKEVKILNLNLQPMSTKLLLTVPPGKTVDDCIKNGWKYE